MITTRVGMAARSWRWRTRVRWLSMSTASSTGDSSRQFRSLAETFTAIEHARGSRDACVSLLAQRLRALLPTDAAALDDSDTRDIRAALFLTASQLAPPHQGVELRFAAKSIAPVLQRLVSSDAAIDWQQLLPSLADYSDAIPLLMQRGALHLHSNPTPLTIAEVHQALVDIASEEGTGSILRKQDRAVALLQRCHSVEELVMLVRLLAHQKLRISMGEKTILAALAAACLPPDTVSKPWTDAVVQAYSQQPDYGALAALLINVVAASDDVGTRTQHLQTAAAPQVGVPVLTMAAYPVTSVAEAVERLRKSGESIATCEYKYDGARVQLHLERGEDGELLVGRVYSRNMEDQTDKYGSLLTIVDSLLSRSIQAVILEGEVVAIDRETNAMLPFQQLQTKTTTEFCLYAFDLLVLDGENLIPRPLMERRAALKRVLTPRDGHVEFVQHDDVDVASDPAESEVAELLMKAVAMGCEGLMVKTLTENAAYRAGARSFAWMKLKHDYLADGGSNSNSSNNNGTFLPDTLDLVPIAAFYGKGRRVGVFGSFLLATVDAATGNYEAIGKVGTGFSDAQLAEMTRTLVAAGEGDAVPPGFVASTVKSARPDVWLRPTQVWEIKATQLTVSPSYLAGHSYLVSGGEKPKGLALRFPRFVRSRPEKAVDQATDSQQIVELFQQQQLGSSDSSSGQD